MKATAQNQSGVFEQDGDLFRQSTLPFSKKHLSKRVRRQGDDSNGQWQGTAAQSAVAGNQSLVDLKAVFVECCTQDLEFYGEIYWSEGRLTARELPYEYWMAGEYEYGEDKTAINHVLAAHGVEREIKMEAGK